MSQITEEIVSKLDILEIISEHVVLKRSGSNYIGLCPFHKEKTPSFGVSATKQIFRCFGCGEGGNVFQFYMRYHNLQFRDALKELAQRAGVQLKEYQAVSKEEVEKKESIKKSLFEINKAATEFYRWNLANSDEAQGARDYIKSRHLSKQMVDKFMIGYAPKSWDALYLYLKKRFTEEEIKACGLLKEKENGGFYDAFRNRIMFPIQNDTDQVIAFGGRTLEEGQAKYINSPETLIYTKGQHLYALNFSRNKIRELGNIILVEGYLDVITCHEFGFENVVASLGTALTLEQSKKILRYTPSKKVIIAYDADKAGQAAAEKGTDVLEMVSKGTGIEIYVLKVPSGKDPDDFLRHNGRSAFQELVDTAKPVLEYQIEKNLSVDISNYEEKAKAIDKCIPLLMKIDSEIYRNDIIKKITSWKYNGVNINIREEDIRKRLKKLDKSENPSNYTKNQNKYQVSPNSRYFDAKKFYTQQMLLQQDLNNLENEKSTFLSEKGVIYFLIERFRAFDYIKTRIKDIYFEDPINETIKNIILELSVPEKPLSWEGLLQILLEPEYQRRIVEIWEDYDIIDIGSDKILKDYIKNVQINSLKLQRDELKRDMEMLLESGEFQAARGLMSTYSEIQIKLKGMQREVYTN